MLPSKRSSGAFPGPATDHFHVQAKWIADVAPTGGLSVNNYVAMNFNPWAPICGVAMTGQWQGWNVVFDQYRVNSMTVRIYPRYNSVEATAVTVATEAVGLEKQMNYATGRGYWAMDMDGPVKTSSQTLMQSYTDNGTWSIFKPFVRTVKYQYPKMFWLDTAKSVGTATDIIKDFGLAKYLGLYAENLPESSDTVVSNQPWARVEVIYDIEFRGPNLNARSQVDAEGKPTGVVVIARAPDAAAALPLNYTLVCPPLTSTTLESPPIVTVVP